MLEKLKRVVGGGAITKREGSDSVITDNLINMNHLLFLDT